MNIRAQITKMLDKGRVKAFADITIEGMFAVHGLKLIETENGRFVGYPANSWKDGNGEYHNSDIAHPVTAEARAEIFKAVNDAYNQKLAETEEMTEDDDLPFGISN